MKQLNFLKTLLLAIALLVGNGMVWGQYSGTGDFTKITSTDDLVDGAYYVLYGINDTNTGALTAAASATRPAATGVTISNSTISDPSSTIVWELIADGTNWLLYNAELDRYCEITANSTSGFSMSTTSTHNYTVTVNNEAFKFQSNHSSAGNRCISIYTTDFRPYISPYTLNLYKLESTSPTITVSESTLSGFSYELGAGPSAEQTFTISGSNLTADISLAAPTNYEISKESGSNYSSPLSFTQSGGEVEETTVYVRLKSGLAVGDYNDEDISATSTDATTKTITCSGTVTSPPPPDAPVADAATDITATGFTANWNPVSGATSYELDVYTSTSTDNTETFTNIEGGTISSYLERTWTGAGSISWTAYKSRIDQVITTDNEAICLRDESDAYIESAEIVGNPTNISFDIMQVFSGSGGKVVVSILYGSSFASTENLGIYDYSTTASFVDIPVSGITGPFKIKIENNTEARPCIDNLTFQTGSQNYIYNYENLSGTSKEISGLDQGTEYFYVVRAIDANGASENSNEITVNTVMTEIEVTESENVSDLPVCTTCELFVNDGGELTIDESRIFEGISVAPGAKLTLKSGSTLTGDLILESDATGTATFVDENTAAITATVEQYLPTGRNWYVGIPITTTTETSLTGAGASSVSYWNEPTGAWVNSYSGALNPGKGYIAVSSAGSATDNISFTGTLNTGDKQISLTRTVGATKEGFNLIANPYPSYLNAMTAINTATELESSIWYRTKGASYSFETVNTASGVGTNNVTGYIPPMQAFWVRVQANSNPLADNSETLTFTNAMRYHANPTVEETPITTTALKAPKANTNKRIRLFVSNGVNSDETILYTNANANNGFDTYDSRKFSNNNDAIPEIYSVLGEENLVINGLNTLELNQVIPLGFKTGESGNFVIKAGELSNLDAGTELVLKDNDIEWKLSEGEEYNFTSDIASTETRFSLVLRAKGTVTGLENETDTNVQVFSNTNNHIVIKTTTNAASVKVFNTVGQQLHTQHMTSNTLEINRTFASGIYFVSVNNEIKKIVIE